MAQHRALASVGSSQIAYASTRVEMIGETKEWRWQYQQGRSNTVASKKLKFKSNANIYTSGRTIGEIVKSLYAFMNLKTLLVIKFCPNWKKTKTKQSPTVQMTSTELL